MEPAIEVERDGLSVEVARRPNGLTLTVHVPKKLVCPAAEMIDALRRQLGPGGSVEGAAKAAGALLERRVEGHSHGARPGTRPRGEWRTVDREQGKLEPALREAGIT